MRPSTISPGGVENGLRIQRFSKILHCVLFLALSTLLFAEDVHATGGCRSPNRRSFLGMVLGAGSAVLIPPLPLGRSAPAGETFTAALDANAAASQVPLILRHRHARLASELSALEGCYGTRWAQSVWGAAGAEGAAAELLKLEFSVAHQVRRSHGRVAAIIDQYFGFQPPVTPPPELQALVAQVTRLYGQMRAALFPHLDDLGWAAQFLEGSAAEVGVADAEATESELVSLGETSGDALPTRLVSTAARLVVARSTDDDLLTEGKISDAEFGLEQSQVGPAQMSCGEGIGH